MFSELQTLSWISRSRISQANMLGHSRYLQEFNQAALIRGGKTGEPEINEPKSTAYEEKSMLNFNHKKKNENRK